jgi:hypothetical protein
MGETSLSLAVGEASPSLCMALWIEGDKMSEHETQLAEVEIGRCHVCAQLFQTQEDLLRHLKEAHGVESLLQPPPK